MSVNSVGRFLTQLGITPQRPLWRAYQQDPEWVRPWVEQEYPRIVRQARCEKAEIWFGDESGVRSDYHAGATWASKGKTPVVRTTGASYRFNMLSAINRRGKMRFMVASGGLNAGVICRFLDRLMVGAKRPLYLILDGHPMHKSRKVACQVARYRGRLKLLFLPPYSPELNPDEGVWREVKANRLGRVGFCGNGNLISKTLGALRHLTYRPDKIRALFQTATTIYAA